LEVVKGLPYFLGAAARLVQTHANLQFLISGAGPEEHNLRRLARELGLAACVTFVSNLHDFSRSISAIDIFCLPSLQQGLGATMLEAMALGRPVIATNVGGIESIITDGQNGLLVPPSDSKLLAARIAELVDDPVKARRIGATGREHVREHFRVATMVEKTAALYRSVADDRLTKIDRTEKPVSLSEMTPH
jgi:glycosyltransferase involved in cell wall biosynthesis